MRGRYVRMRAVDGARRRTSVRKDGSGENCSVFWQCSCLASVPRVLAQVAGTGTIEGTVEDTAGAVIPSCRIEVTNVATGQKVAQTTSSTGTYSIPALAPGVYTVQATATGFRTLLEATLSSMR